MLAFRGLERVPVEKAEGGRHRLDRRPDQGTVADTICDPSVTEPLQAQPIDPPTLSMTFASTTRRSPAREGDKVTSRMIRDRLMREAEGNVAIRVTEAPTRTASMGRRAAANCSSAC
jgi:GTP-binding protein